MHRAVVLSISIATAASAYGEPVAIEKRDAVPPDEAQVVEVPSAAAVRGAPLPGDESGRTDRDGGDGVARRLGRAILWVPRLPAELVAQPVRGLLYMEDRYDVVEHVTSWFTTEDGRIAVFPTAFFETGFGLDVGARGYFSDLIGGERIALRAGYGGSHRWVAELDLARRTGRVTPSLELRAQARDGEAFYGIGNTDEDSAGFRVAMLRALPRLRVALSEHVAATTTVAIVQKHYEGDGAMPVDPAQLAETRYAHSELQIAWDTRRRTSRWDAHGVRGGGGLVLGFAGYQHGLRDEPAFARAGLDVQRYLRLSDGPRVLELRAYAEAVTGVRDEMMFTEMPRLGGANLLRGYASGRFRDRVATVGQVAYRWAAASWLAPAVFVDAGRVHPGLDQLALDDMRVGFGGSLEAYGRSGMKMRVQIASSIDGGAFVYLSLEPAFDMRTERY